MNAMAADELVPPTFPELEERPVPAPGPTDGQKAALEQLASGTYTVAVTGEVIASGFDDNGYGFVVIADPNGGEVRSEPLMLPKSPEEVEADEAAAAEVDARNAEKLAAYHAELDKFEAKQREQLEAAATENAARQQQEIQDRFAKQLTGLDEYVTKKVHEALAAAGVNIPPTTTQE